MNGFCVRKDGQGWRRVEDETWCMDFETFQTEEPPLPVVEPDPDNDAVAAN
ncbi:hypothetical protein [Escherichia coli]|uniref:hypothetical protein n=1 Tax=Escherichia coli TaxID=562 RepID=UPI001C5CCFDC|nr:hypothetical protein [Escherichia coli]